MNFFKSQRRYFSSLWPLRFAVAILMLLPGCGGQRSRNEATLPDVNQSIPRVEYHAETQFDCYPTGRRGGWQREQLKVGSSLDERDLAVLATLFTDVVARDLTIENRNSRQTPDFIVTLATQDEHDIVPSAQFLESISSDSLHVLAPHDSLQQLPDCELRLWAWTANDSAYVEATVWSWNQSRSAVVFRENGKWKACGSNRIGQLNQIRVPPTKK